MVSVVIKDSQKYCDNQIYLYHHCITITPPITLQQHTEKSNFCHPIIVKDANKEADLGWSIQPTDCHVRIFWRSYSDTSWDLMFWDIFELQTLNQNRSLYIFFLIICSQIHEKIVVQKKKIVHIL